MQLFSESGLDPEKMVMQILIWIMPTVWALILIWQRRARVAPWPWVALVLILPVLGAVLAISFVWSAKPTPLARGEVPSPNSKSGFWMRVRTVLRDG